MAHPAQTRLEDTKGECDKLSEELEKLMDEVTGNRAVLDRYMEVLPEQAQLALLEGLRASRKAVALVAAQIQIEFGED